MPEVTGAKAITVMVADAGDACCPTGSCSTRHDVDIQGDLLLADGMIREATPSVARRRAEVQVMDAKGKVVVPGSWMCAPGRPARRRNRRNHRLGEPPGRAAGGAPPSCASPTRRSSTTPAIVNLVLRRSRNLDGARRGR